MQRTAETNSVPTPAPAPAAGEKPLQAPLPLIVKGSLHELFIQMKQELEGISAFPSAFTRTDYLLNLCFETGAQSGQDILQKIAGHHWDECPWFTIPIEHLSEKHYARFLYTFVNMVYNPELEFRSSVDGDPSTGARVPSSTAYMNQCFSWLHAHSLKLTQIVRKVAPTWDANADTALVHVAGVCKRDRERYDAYLRAKVKAFVDANMPKGASKEDIELGEQVTRRAFTSTLRTLVTANHKKLKIEARRCGITILGMLMVSLEFDDVYMRYQVRREQELKDEAKALNDASKAAADAKLIFVPSVTPGEMIDRALAQAAHGAVVNTVLYREDVQ